MKLDCHKCIHAKVCAKCEVAQTNCMYFKDKRGFVEVPFKIGDIIWVNTYEGGDRTHDVEMIECTVRTMRFNGSKMEIIFSCYGWYSNGSKYRAYFKMDSIGKTVFSTREEALQTLERVCE